MNKIPIDNITLSLNKKQSLAIELFEYLTFESNDSKNNKNHNETSYENAPNSTKVYLSQNKDKVRYAIEQLIDKYMNTDLDGIINDKLQAVILSSTDDKFGLDQMTNSPSYLFVLEAIKISSQLLDTHTITINPDTTTKKSKSISLFDMLDSTNWNDIITSDTILETYHSNNNKVEAYKQIIPLLRNVQDIEDMSNNWKELNDVILKPSLSLDSNLAIEYHNIHYDLFNKCDQSTVTIQYDLMMNILCSIDEPLNGNAKNVIIKMLLSFYTKIKHLSSEDIDKFYITLFSILRYDKIHMVALNDIYADWFVLYAKQVPSHQLMQYLLYTHWIYDIIHCVAHSNIKYMHQVPSDFDEDLAKDDVEYVTYIHSLSIFKTILVITKFKLLPWEIIQTVLNKEYQQNKSLCLEHINQLKPLEDYKYIRIYVNYDNKQSLLLNDSNLVKQIIVKPFLSTLTHEINTKKTVDYDEKIFDICIQPIQLLITYYYSNDNNTILQELVTILLDKLSTAISVVTLSKKVQVLNLVGFLLLSFKDGIVKLLASTKSSNQVASCNETTRLFIKSLIEFISSSVKTGRGMTSNSIINCDSIDDKMQSLQVLQCHFKIWLSLLSLLDSINEYIEYAASCDLVNAENCKEFIKLIRNRFSQFCTANHLKYEEALFEESFSPFC